MSRTLTKSILSLALLALVIPAAGCKRNLASYVPGHRGGYSYDDSDFGFSFDFGSVFDVVDFGGFLVEDPGYYDGGYEEYGYEEYGYDEYYYGDDWGGYDDWKTKHPGAKPPRRK